MKWGVMRKKDKNTKGRGMAGLTLVEILVALAISMLLGTGIYQIFVGTTRSYVMNEDLARLQENGRFAIHFLRSEIRGAGYLGCLQDVDKVVSTLNKPVDFLFDFKNAIYGAEAIGGGWQDEVGVIDPVQTGTDGMGLNPAPLSGSDILVIRGIRSDIPISIITGMPPTSADLKLTAGLATMGLLDTGGGDILLISDCEAAAVFQTTSYTDSNGNTVHNTGTSAPVGNMTKNLGKAFKAGAEIFFPQTVVFYIANNALGEPALFRKTGTSATAVEIISGVENMQVRYGEDTSLNGAVDLYRNANQIGDWQRVLSARVGLLLRSPESRDSSAPVNTTAYDVSGDGNTDFTAPGDRRMRMIFSGTVALRNRVR
jgi:type IV pilus assembly protein PilW